MKKIQIAAILVMSLFAAAEEPSGKFAGSSQTCVSAISVTTLGPVVPRLLRFCLVKLLTKEEITQVSVTNNWPLLFSGKFVDIYKSADGDAFYTVNYDRNGKANEVLVYLDGPVS